MYSEVIHTRCGDGIDLKKGQTPVSGGGTGGFKVYSCTPNVTDDGVADLQFLDKVLSEKQPYNDPSFMDDAYLYYVPDVGKRILVNFHPIHFDRTAKAGNYPHRPGNFINQGFLGDFADFYAYETFGNSAVWDAQERGEAYYYENAPAPLPERGSLSEEIGNIGLDDIAEFVADGRRDALKSAVAFIIAQYDLLPEERQFIVIRDEDARHIELWIAAIESAFSPRMASGISFASRLDKFTTSNKYTVNLNGTYQPAINLQSKDQKLRYRAMIVGVDERDRANSSAARALPNSPYVILDGKTKSFSAQIDASDKFFNYVTEFDDGHSYFCREFMQTAGLAAPTSDVLALFDAYTRLECCDYEADLSDVAFGLGILGKYELAKTSYLVDLYSRVKANLPKYLKEGPARALPALNWLIKVSAIVGDEAASEQFKQIVCKSFAESVFASPQNDGTNELVEIVRTSSYLGDAVEYLTSENAVAEHEGCMQMYTSPDWLAFTDILISCLGGMMKPGEPFPGATASIIARSMRALYYEKEDQGAEKIAEALYRLNSNETLESLLSDAASSRDRGYIEFCIMLACETAPEIAATDDNLDRFYQSLKRFGLQDFYPVALALRAREVSRPKDMEQFLDYSVANLGARGMDISPILRALDGNLGLTDKAAVNIAAKIQNSNSTGVPCICSAHICALRVMDDKIPQETITSLLESMATQGFPSIEDHEFANLLIKKLFSNKVSEDSFASVVRASEKSAYYANLVAREAFKHLGTKQEGYIGEVIEAAASINGQNLRTALISCCAEMKNFDKGTTAARAYLNTRRAQQYFASITESAFELREQHNDGSIFGKMFSRGSGGGSGRRHGRH